MSTLHPPTPRDFEIHRANQIEKASTRQLAAKYNLSQTRIRQIARRVNNFLALTLPKNSDIDPEQEARLARAIAADQLQHQAELLQTLFEGTTDPKYLRHQSRVVLAQARLGVLPGAIDEALESLGSASDGPVATEGNMSSSADDLSFRTLQSPICNLQSQHQRTSQSAIRNPQSAIRSAPPPRDCSPQTPIVPCDNLHENAAFAATTDNATPSAAPPVLDEQEIAGLQLMESRLLTLLENTDLSDDRRESFQRALTSVRQNLATVPANSIPKNTATKNTPTENTPTENTPTENTPTENTVTEIKLAPAVPGLTATSTTPGGGRKYPEAHTTQNHEQPVSHG